ncbi:MULTISPECIES: LysR family transcriptional regulator [Caulobacter]|jgi:DNA-binding transcriptional LysR family regulator|uniref:Transcriptional regulator n=1 Tax=Caulobacter vibrioides OR37 TaxID=1292034 RepID=R0D3B3_CAUVI|nr:MULTISPECIES: LysR family transcriptional regulator [Caulobacter]ENZ82925.1 transcriptional regulator [Caulobacter vibrioides OR37]MBQ1559690.1 LysR family transcriptional regulator [Caulobacter sp.]
MFDWDDARVFLEAARTGSLNRAALRLGIDPATVGRRVSRLESALKATLLARSATGLELTSAGQSFLRAVTQAETAMGAAAEVGQDQPVGTVRISAAEGFGSVILAPALVDLAAEAPTIRVELAANSGFLSPSRREVDLAVTLSAPNAARLDVEPLTDYDLALYAADDYLAAHGAPRTVDELHGHRIVGYVDDLLYAQELRYLDEIAPGLKPHLASSSIRAQREIIAAGGGVGVLPCFLADGLRRVLPGEVRLRRRFWLSAHHEVSGAKRVRLVRQWLKTLCARETGRLRAPADQAGR